MRFRSLRQAVDVGPAVTGANGGDHAGSDADEVLLSRYRDRLVGAAPMLGTLPEAEQRVCVATLVEGWLGDDGLPAGDLRDHVLVALVDDIVGYGPLEGLLHDDEVTEIMVNRPDSVFVERRGRIAPAGVFFRDGAHVRCVIERLVMASGRRIDDASPMVDARLADGSRLNAVLPPIALNGPTLTIRRTAHRRLAMSDLVDRGAVGGTMAAFLHAAVLGRCNVLVTGGTGAGKTTVLGALAGLIPVDQRIVTLEDVAELNIDHPHVVGQECRPGSAGSADRVALADLVRNSLRMRPDRILVGEVRGAEAADMVQAMNTGHPGSMATLHANSAHEALTRLESMLAQGFSALPVFTFRAWIGTAIDLIVHCDRTAAGHRQIADVATCTLGDDGALYTDSLFRGFGDGDDFRACGEVPVRCLERMAQNGVRFPARLFAVAA